MKSFRTLTAAFAILISSHAFAHSLKTVGAMSTHAANEALELGEEINRKNESTTAVNSYHVVDVDLANGESPETAYVKILESALHRDYPLTGDDGGYEITALSRDASVREIGDALGDTAFSNSHELVRAIKSASEAGLLIVAGSGLGHNTMATILAIVDVKKSEILYFVDANFGSGD